MTVIIDSIATKLARIEVPTVNGVATAKIKIPSEGRTITGGAGMFLAQNPRDFVTMYLADDDDVLNNGAGVIVKTYSDLGVPSGNQGKFFLSSTVPFQIKGAIENETSDLPGDFWLYIVATKYLLAADVFLVNLDWGSRIR